KSEVEKIVSRLGSSSLGTASSHWATGIDQRTIKFQEAQKRFETSSGADRIQWISFIGGNNRADDRGFTTPQRMRFLLKVISEDTSLQNVHYAEYLFRLNS